MKWCVCEVGPCGACAEWGVCEVERVRRGGENKGMCEQAEDRKQMDVVAGGAGRLGADGGDRGSADERMHLGPSTRGSSCDRALEANPGTTHWGQPLRM